MCEIMNLKEGLELAKSKNACNGNLKPFKNALSEYDILECYQIALGNHSWLLYNGIIEKSDLPELEKLAQGVGKVYYENRKIYHRATYKNCELNGPYERWYSNGSLMYRFNYKNGERHGLYEEWNREGSLRFKCEYKNGKIISETGWHKTSD